jgi:prepilin-type N-terminal cleavage/methylation domain-containing protein
MTISVGACWSKPLNAGIYDSANFLRFKGDRGMKANTLCKKTNRNKEEGFTLIEVLVAIALFTVGVLATLSMQSSVIKTYGLARNSTEATTFASDLLERLNSLPYNDATYLSAGGHPAADPDVREGRVDFAVGANLRPDTPFTYTYRIDQDAMIPDTKTITISVSYTYHGMTRTVQLVSVKPDTI